MLRVHAQDRVRQQKHENHLVGFFEKRRARKEMAQVWPLSLTAAPCFRTWEFQRAEYRRTHGGCGLERLQAYTRTCMSPSRQQLRCL